MNLVERVLGVEKHQSISHSGIQYRHLPLVLNLLEKKLVSEKHLLQMPRLKPITARIPVAPGVILQVFLNCVLLISCT